jgi:hypothetical protein
MVEAESFVHAAKTMGFQFFTGVPCSYLNPLINHVIGRPDTDYVGATSEGEAVAIAAGAWLGGRQTVVMCQAASHAPRVILPGMLILLGTLPFWETFRQRTAAQAVMRGVNAAVVGVLGGSALQPHLDELRLRRAAVGSD